MLEGIFNTTLVFLVIGVLIVLLLSFAAMVIFNWVADRLRWRSKFLCEAIQQILGNDDLTMKLYAHPLVANLYQLGRKPGKQPRLPSYIPANKFASALFDILTRAETIVPPIANMNNEILTQVDAMESRDRESSAREDWRVILKIAEETASAPLSEAAIDSLVGMVHAFGEKYPETKPAIDMLLPQVVEFYQKLLAEESEAGPELDLAREPVMRRFQLGLVTLETTSPRLKETLEALLRNTQTSSTLGDSLAHRLHSGVEEWFNDTMDALSVYYKQKTQVAYFIIGIALAFFLNVDSGKILTSLWYQATYPQRQGILAQTVTYLGNNPTPGSDLYTLVFGELQFNLDILKFPLGWQFEAFDTVGKQCSLVPVNAGQAWGIPSQDEQGTPLCKRLTNLPVDALGWLGKLAGLVATGAFIPVGGSILFDMMKKMVNVRSLGSEPAG